MKCPCCPHDNEMSAKFCEECAAPFARACAKCGRSPSGTAKFCRRSPDRGLRLERYWSDMTVFDPATIADRATYEDLQRYPVGISAVIANGGGAAGEHTGVLSGRVLRCRQKAPILA